MHNKTLDENFLWEMRARSGITPEAWESYPQTYRDAYEDLEAKAYADLAIGTYGRNAFGILLERGLGRLNSGVISGFCLSMVDLDGLKEINDSYGHDFGTEALELFAGALKDSVRSGKDEKGEKKREPDFVCRYGGDELAIITGNSLDERRAITLVTGIEERLKAKLPKRTYPYRLAGSVGGAFVDGNADAKYREPRELVRRADDAMYHTKKLHRKGDNVLAGLWTPKKGLRLYRMAGGQIVDYHTGRPAMASRIPLRAHPLFS
jgi:diguanylate cyclase (GGDEF)-like protein